MGRIAGVYEIKSAINGHIYIGSSYDIKKRWNEHKLTLSKGTHHSIYLQRAWNKYGAENFTFTILELVEDKEERIKAEQMFLDTRCPEYNMCPKASSRLGSKASPETIVKLKAIGANLSDEQRAWKRQNLLTKAVPAARNRVRTEADHEWSVKHYQDVYDRIHAKHEIICVQCGKVFMAEKGRFCSNSCKSQWRRDNGLDDETRICKMCGKEFAVNKYSDVETCSRSCGKKRSHLLNPMTEETRAKISESRKGQTASEETKLKMSKSHIGKKYSVTAKKQENS